MQEIQNHKEEVRQLKNKLEKTEEEKCAIIFESTKSRKSVRESTSL